MKYPITMNQLGYVKVTNNVVYFYTHKDDGKKWHFTKYRKYTWEEFITEYPFECSWGNGYRRTNHKKYI